MTRQSRKGLQLGKEVIWENSAADNRGGELKKEGGDWGRRWAYTIPRMLTLIDIWGWELIKKGVGCLWQSWISEGPEKYGLIANTAYVSGEGNGTPLQYSCLENPMDGEAWKATLHGVTEGQTWLSDFTFTFHFHALEKEMATHCSVLAWRIPGTGEPGGLPNMGSHTVGHDWSDSAAAAESNNIYG